MVLFKAPPWTWSGSLGDENQIRRLRERIDLLEEEVRQLRAIISPDASFEYEALKIRPVGRKMLAKLVNACPNVVSYETMAMQSYGREPMLKNTVTAHVMRLRRKLKVIGVEVKSSWGFGYYITKDDKARIEAAVAS